MKNNEADNFPPYTEDFIYCQSNGLLDDEVGYALTQIWQAGVCDDDIGQMIEQRVQKHKLQQALYGGSPFKTPKLLNGDYVVGLDSEKNELRSTIQYLNAHCITAAGSGAGKTTLSYFKILQIALFIIGMWLFDLRKKEFCILQPFLKRLGIDLIILPARFMKINPLQLPEGVELKSWIPRVADMLTEVLALPPRASKSLQAKLFLLYQKFSKQNEFPTLFDLFELVKISSDINFQAKTAILDNLEPVLLSLGPEVLAYRQGWSTSDLAERPICFELAGVSETDKNLLLNSLILSEFTSRVDRGISNPQMDLWICLDEAQRICSSSSQTSAIGDQIGLIRGTGIGLDLSVQNITDVLPQIISNTATKILGRCGSIGDYTTAGHSMGLSAEQIHWGQMTLKPGLFIGQLGEGSCRHPFVFNIPKMNIPASVRNNLRSDIGTLTDIPVVYASEFDKWGQPESFSTESDSPKVKLFASDKEFRFCQAVVENPLKPSSAYASIAKVSPKYVKKIREQLITKQYIKEHVLDSGGRGRSTLLLEPLPAGIDAVRQEENLCI